MKLFFIKYKYSLLFFVLFFLASCSILEYEEEKNNIKFSKTNIKQNKCPVTKIPSNTANYVLNKKYILSIKKVEIACRSKESDMSNLFDIVVQYKAQIELKTNNKINKMDSTLPSMFIAIVDMKSETVLAKMKSNIELINKEDNLIVNKKKFRFKYESYDDLSIYFGLQ